MLAAPAIAAEPPVASYSLITCPGSEDAPAAADATVDTLLCLHNEVRSAHGLPLLKLSGRLSRAAAAHSADMVAERYFAHVELVSGDTLVDRLLATRYMRRNADWSVGENLAWGTGALATPAAVMRAWMASPGHRRNLLRRGYRELGVGTAAGVPTDPAIGTTYTANFGVRR